jgi:hypothetical protein
MAAPERLQRTPENNDELLAHLEYINQDENPIERARRIDQFYDEIDELNAQVVDEQGTADPTPRD